MIFFVWDNEIECVRLAVTAEERAFAALANWEPIDLVTICECGALRGDGHRECARPANVCAGFRETGNVGLLVEHACRSLCDYNHGAYAVSCAVDFDPRSRALAILSGDEDGGWWRRFGSKAVVCSRCGGITWRDTAADSCPGLSESVLNIGTVIDIACRSLCEEE